MNKVFIIAEAGVNHNGSVEIAKKLINSAVDAGVDAVKFQTFKAKNLLSKSASKAEYQRKTTKSDESQFEMIKKLELNIEDHNELIRHCNKNNIIFLSSPFDLESIDLLKSLDIEIYKIPSGEITNLPYLKKIGYLKKRIILSTGMSNIGEIESALNILISSGTLKRDITVLHANTEYPTPMIDVNLNAMTTIANAFKVKVGYSDHTLGTEVAIAAVAMGASVIEKHFTLDRTMEGPDHKASLEPNELKTMVKSLRNIEVALGDGLKIPSSSELKNIHIARKSVIAKTMIKKGDFFCEENIVVKRPGNGISPMLYDKIIGKRSLRDFAVDEPITL